MKAIRHFTASISCGVFDSIEMCAMINDYSKQNKYIPYTRRMGSGRKVNIGKIKSASLDVNGRLEVIVETFGNFCPFKGKWLD